MSAVSMDKGGAGASAATPPGGPSGAPAAVPDERTPRRERIAAAAQRRGSLVVLVLLVAVASASFDTFFTGDNLSNIALQSSFLAVVALGMTFVILTGGIDLSVGSVYALGGVLAAWASQYGTVWALVVPLAVCGAIGLLNGVLVARLGMAPFIVTLVTLLFARGLLLALTKEGSTTYLVPAGSAFATMGQGTLFGVGYPVYIAVGLYLLGTLLLQRTRFGQTVFAIGGAADAARLMGLPVRRVTVSVYVMSGMLAGFGGAMLAAQSSSGVTIVGVGLELSAISAVVIGGTLLSGGAGTTGGTLAGVVILGVIANIINQIGSLNSSYQDVVNGGFLVVVVLAQTFLAAGNDCDRRGVTSMLTSGAHAERRLRILKAKLAENGALSVAEAAALTGASTATAARDLSLLAETVGAQRVRGGVVTDEQDPVDLDPPLEAVLGATESFDLERLSIQHAEQATWSLQAGDVATAEVHARLAQAMATLSAARRPDAGGR